MSKLRDLVSTTPLKDVAARARLLLSLPAFLHNPIGAEEAKATLRQRLREREADFLSVARTAIYPHPSSPYRTLLELAGCEYGDLERLVRLDGVEAALRGLYRQGVYLTLNEFKGRQPAVRGSATIPVNPTQALNPHFQTQVPAQTSGTRNHRTAVIYDLAHVRERAVNILLVLDALDGTEWVHATWGVPGGGGVVHLLDYSALGSPPVRWFSQLDPAAAGLHPRYRWSARVLRWASILAGIPLPRPLHVPLENCLPIAHWMAAVLQTGRRPHLITFPSSALRVCQAAIDDHLDLHGACFTLGGEPVTRARLQVIDDAGARVVQRYAAAEASHIGYGCLAPDAPDDQHLLHDFNALIQPGQDGQCIGLEPSTLLISSLRPTAPFILLNVSLGDQAEVAQRSCGCPLEKLGWTTHVQKIRSDQKLTAGGMTFLDVDVMRVIEEVLPARFGGRPTDYQLLEEEIDGGQPRIRLLVHPALGPLDFDAIEDTFLTAIGGGSPAAQAMVLQWRQARLVMVERRPPLSGASGKILHLHRRPPGAAEQS